MYHNVEKAFFRRDGASWVGWSADGRHWRIHKARGYWVARERDGFRSIMGNRLKDISDKLAATASSKNNSQTAGIVTVL